MQSSKPFIKEYFKKLPAGVAILLIFFIASIWLFAYIGQNVHLNKEHTIDNYIFSHTDALVHPSFTVVMKAITFCASSIFLQVGYGLIAIFFLVKKNWKRAIEIAAIGIGGYIINYVMKISFQRDRPSGQLVEQLQNYSFPSGHATSAFIFYGMLVYLLWKTKLKKVYKYLIATLLIIFSVMIGFSRIYLRVHFPSDVVAGFCVGFFWLFLTVFVFEMMKKRADNKLSANKVREK